MKNMPKNQALPALLLRIGLAAVFLYAAISSLQHPIEWYGYVPSFMTKHLSAKTVLDMLAIYEIVLGLWLLSGKFVKYAAMISAVTLAGIVVVNTSQLIITFRDIGLAFAALALYFSDK